jgi:H+/Na+-translocating ferredoxin:NAD+ oxidoreductase subunit D
VSAAFQARGKAIGNEQMLRQVLLALLPGIATTIWFLGWGVIFNSVLALAFSLGCEALSGYFRKHPLAVTLRDSGTWITALLLGLALPPFAAWWLILLGAIGAMALKQMCGGRALFNPAMAAYVLLLLIFPAQFAHWSGPAAPLDGYTMATALDTFKQNRAFTVAVWWKMHPQFGSWGGYGWEWINLAFLGGGVYLLQQKIIGWQIPVALLAMLAICAAIFYDNGSSASGGSPFYHWLSGATMLGAFFIATDPATSATTNKGRLCYGALIGLSIYIIRSWGHYADGVAFAVLLGNGAAPLLDKLGALWPRAKTSAAGTQHAD